MTFYKYGNNFTFSVLSLLYPHLDYRNQFHIDHIFPKSLFTKVALRKRKLSEDDIEIFIDYFNYIGNLQLLAAIPNIEKKDTEFKVWLKQTYPTDIKQKEFKKIHNIPDVSLEFDNFIEFLEEREKLLKEEFKKILQI